jgi:hypothetical protein
MNKLLQNLQHLASTIPGVALTIASSVLAFVNLPAVQQLAGANASIARYVAAATAFATGITLIFCVGPKK